MRCRLAVALVAGCSVLGLVGDAYGSDWQGRGFLGGVGVGWGETFFRHNFKSHGVTTKSDRKRASTLMTDFKIGYAPSNSLQLYWMSQVSWFSTWVARDKKATVSTGVGGLGVSYYFRPEAPSAYLCGGVGFSGWSTPFEAGSKAWTGLGVASGAGYEFARHFSIEGNLLWGNPSKTINGGKASKDILSAKLTVNVLGY